MTYPAPARARYLHAGLFLTTLGLLLLELLDSRLLAVVTPYYLSFLAISTAMLGGAAGAVFVFLKGPAFVGDKARAALPRWATGLALTTVVSHAALVRIPVKDKLAIDAEVFTGLAVATVLLTLPFFVAGVTITLALTRSGGPIGKLYAFDLAGAALGCLLVVPLLNHADMATALTLAATIVATGAVCFAHFHPTSSAWPARLTLAVLLAMTVASPLYGSPLELGYIRGRPINTKRVERQVWNAHSHVAILHPAMAPAFVWGEGRRPKAESVIMFIDGDAATPLTRWDGDPDSVAWLDSDVTTIAHRLNPNGHAGIMGVGGGRDVLSAIRNGAKSITAVEINGTFIDVLEHSHRDFANLADRPEVTLVHDEARAFMTRHSGRFDVLEMSLVDTWAATAAGAFTLTENGLYTREAWNTFLRRLSPRGIFSTSRWFAPARVSETNRLVGLGVAALLDLGAKEPAQHLAMVASGSVATMLVARNPLLPRTLKELKRICEARGFELLLAPGLEPRDQTRHLAAIAEARDHETLEAALADPHFDYRPPTDERPYFFNMLRLGAMKALLFPSGDDVVPRTRGVMWGNIRATGALGVLAAVATVLVLLLVLLPLARSGRPEMHPKTFAAALAYFGILGAGFMHIQIALLQRVSVYLGHPVYSYVVILFTMILAAGAGSYLSERLSLDRGRWPRLLGPSIAAYTAALAIGLPTVLSGTQGLGLDFRCAQVAAIVAPLSCLLGLCFPLGMRMLERLSEDAKPWMWGVNGATGVLASIAAVVLSMFVGIRSNFVVAAGLYACLTPLSLHLLSRGRSSPSS